MAKSLRRTFKALPEREGGPPRRPPQGAVVGEFPAPAGAPSVYRRTSNGDTAMQKKDYAYTGYRYKSVENGRKLRKNMTKQERHLWYDFLRSYPVQFYRQRAIDRFIVDFYCAKARFVIKLDGSQHYTVEGMGYDRLRTEILEKYHLEVLRFTNLEVDREFDAVCRKL